MSANEGEGVYSGEAFMLHSDLQYLERRTEQELARAQAASRREVATAHCELSNLFFDPAAALRAQAPAVTDQSDAPGAEPRAHLMADGGT